MFEEINKTQYDKFKAKLEQEKEQLLSEYEKEGIQLSNLEKAIEKALNYSLKLSDMWVYGDLEQKRKLQRMVFPDGIEYDHENDIYRTFRTNAIFDVIRSFSKRSGNKKTGNFQNKLKKSGLVLGAGLEPAR